MPDVTAAVKDLPKAEEAFLNNSRCREETCFTSVRPTSRVPSLLRSLVAFLVLTTASAAPCYRADADFLAPDWTQGLPSRLTTVSFSLTVHADSDLWPTLDIRSIDSSCRTYLQTELDHFSAGIQVAPYSELALKSGSNSTVYVHYLVTLKKWPNGASKSDTIIGAVQYILKRPGPRMSFPQFDRVDVFQSSTDPEALKEAIQEALNTNIQSSIVFPIKGSLANKSPQ
jgi:hypothetical protein